MIWVFSRFHKYYNYSRRTEASLLKNRESWFSRGVNSLIISREKSSGITLIELLIVIGVAALLAVVAIPSYLNQLEHGRAKSAAESVYNFLVLGRSEASKRNANINVVFQTSSNWCAGMTTAATCDCSVSGACNVGEVNAANFNKVTLALSGLATTGLTFEPTRGEVNQTGTITLTSGSSSIVISLSSIGLVSVCSNTVPGYSAC